MTRFALPATRPKADATEADLDRWAPFAACRSVDPAWFFGREFERPKERSVREAGAKRICGRCPVADLCLAWALRVNEAGFWAGTNEEGRMAMKRRAARELAKIGASS